MNWRGLRIALIGPLPPPAGGMGDQMLQLSEMMRREGAEVTVLQTNGVYRPAWIAPVRGVRAAVRFVPYVAALWRTAGSVEVFHVLASSGWSWHLFAVPAIVTARIRATPCVVSYHGGEAEAFLVRSARLVSATLRAAQALTVPSGFLRQVFARFAIDSRIVPNVVDLTLFNAKPARTSNAPHVVVPRNLEPIYDIPTALRAFAVVRQRLPDATLSVAGSGSELKSLNRLAEALGIESAVTFTGRLSREQMASLFGRADLVLNPSTADNMPVSILEAMASGVPVVSTSVGGIPYLLDDGRTALLVESGDASAMAEAALRLLEDKALAARVADAARIEVQQYSWPHVRVALEQVYEDVLRPERARQPAV
jgi:glycosyltransferase involved in cell wall biosynthesis